jgi:hypothetical protein
MSIEINELRSTDTAIEVLAQKTIDKGITEPDIIIAIASNLYKSTNEKSLIPFCHKRLNLLRAWNLRKMKFQSGEFEGKKACSSVTATRHTVKVLKDKGYNFKFVNNLDFLYHLFKQYDMNYLEFCRIITNKDTEFLNKYSVMQIEALEEYGHLKIE